MKIIQLVPNFDLGGMQKAGCILAKGMAELGNEVFLIGKDKGPRFNNYNILGLSYVSVEDYSTRVLVEQINLIQPDVIHIHTNIYEEIPIGLVEKLRETYTEDKTIIIVTPVFGRPPSNKNILLLAKTCCVGHYTYYRLRNWLNLSVTDAFIKGIFCVPLTPFEPNFSFFQQNNIQLNETARAKFNLPKDALVITRIGRNEVGKWHGCYEDLINKFLSETDNSFWISIGYPVELGLDRLKKAWPNRFLNFEQTSDYNFLSQVLLAADLQIFFSLNGECFSSTICESVCFGAPVIAGYNLLKDNGQAEQIIDGVTGYLVSNSNDAFKKLIELNDDKLALEALKLKCAEYGLSNWHMLKVCKDLIDIYNYYLSQNEINKATVANMLQKQQGFENDYEARMQLLINKSNNTAIKKQILKIAFWATQQWKIFVVGRYFKTIISKVV